MFLVGPLINFALHVQVQTLNNPSKAGFCKILDSYNPSIVYLQGEQIANDEVGPLVWEGVDISTPEAMFEIFATTLPTAVCDISIFIGLSAFFMCIHHFILSSSSFYLDIYIY